jgi:hypothetical protein
MIYHDKDAAPNQQIQKRAEINFAPAFDVFANRNEA